MATGTASSVAPGAFSGGTRPDASASPVSPAPASLAPSTANPIYFILLDATLKEQRIELLGFRSGEISFRDEAGQTRIARLDDVAALLPSWWSPRTPADDAISFLAPIPGRILAARPGMGFIELTDGQRIGSTLCNDSPASHDLVYWATGNFGDVSTKIDMVRRIWLSQAAAIPAPTPTALSPIGTAPKPRADVPPLGINRPIIDKQPAAKSDSVTLANGDTLSGFIDGIGPVVSIDVDGRKIQTPSSQVVEIRLLNGPRPPNGTRLWLSGGMVIDAATLSPDVPLKGQPRPDFVRVELSTDAWKRIDPPVSEPAPGKPAPKKPAPKKPTPASSGAISGSAPQPRLGTDAPPFAFLNIPQIDAVVPHVERLVSLASQPLMRQSPIGDRVSYEPVAFTWAGSPLNDEPGTLVVNLPGSAAMKQRFVSTPPPMGAADIALSGPMQAEWSIPTDTVRIAGWAELPRDCWTWGNCVVVISITPAARSAQGPTELLRETLSSDHPTVEFNLDLEQSALKDRVLTVAVEAGERGPIQDHVVLHRVLLLRKPAPSK